MDAVVGELLECLGGVVDRDCVGLHGLMLVVLGYLIWKISLPWSCCSVATRRGP